MDKSNLGLAGEFAVASELCRRDVYAQPTFGNQKRLDLLALVSSSRHIRIEVKAKQKGEWPSCKGISGENVFLVFVDFAGKSDTERPDFYVLSSNDWRQVVERELERLKQKYPDQRSTIGKIGDDDENVLTLWDKVDPSRKCYEGCVVKPESIQTYKDAWDKIASTTGQELKRSKTRS